MILKPIIFFPQDVKYNAWFSSSSLYVCGGWVDFYLIRLMLQFPALLRPLKEKLGWINDCSVQWYGLILFLLWIILLKHFFMLTIGFIPIFCVVACFTLLFFPEYQYHLGRGHIGASMKTKLYHLLEQRSSTWYLFLNFELLVAHFSSTSEFSDLILFIL